MRVLRITRSGWLPLVLASVGCGASDSPVAGGDDAGAFAGDARDSASGGPVGGGDTSAPSGGCVPSTCAQLGVDCGPHADGCGATLDCGVCAPALHTEGGRFVDRAGRTVVLRGVNVAGDAKVPPFRPVTSPAYFDPIAAMGHNVVRLLFNWEAYETTRGAYDASYLDSYVAAVEGAASHDLFVVVDFHQDAFSRYSLGGCGDGMPPWAIPSSIPRATPNNGASCSNWGFSMIFDSQMQATWKAFYANQDGVRDAYLAMIARVAQRLAGERAVIGYDMMNEPWGDEATDIHALYEDAAKAIRGAVPTAILFLSPNALTSSGSKSSLTRPTFDNFAFAQHFYDSGVFLSKSWSGSSLDGSFANLRSVADALGAPLFVGEFGDPPSTGNIAGYINAVHDELDSTLASGTQWAFTAAWTDAAKDGWNMEDFSIVDNTGAPRANFVPRPYPRAIAGTPTHFALTGTTAADHVVELTWTNAPAAGATELFVPTQALFGAAAVVAEGTGTQLSCAMSGTQVLCSSPASGAMQVRVHVK